MPGPVDDSRSSEAMPLLALRHIQHATAPTPDDGPRLNRARRHAEDGAPS